ncbi:hypothetical protein DY000_02018728 [Brassica cretica]|uniref:Uncharacterized protein n=1 Tax=Brassica cretica TaxID=69181 RepID=A0ABQ7CRU0_BRACR|nr:hypothetical protein DY000_02018728 [Brassica cretica]
MGLMLLFRGSESLLLLLPLPEPPLFVFPLDLLDVVSAPDPPDPPDERFFHSRRTGSVLFFCHCFTLAAARSPLHCTTTSDSVCLLIVSLGVNLVKPLLLPTDGYRFGFLVLHIRNHSRPLPQYEDLMLLVSHCLTQYEAVRHLVCLPLPQYEVHLPQYEISSQFQGSSRWCLITSVAKFLSALYAFVAAACLGSSSMNVFSNSRGFISLSSIHAVYLGNVAVLLFLLNNSSIDGV